MIIDEILDTLEIKGKILDLDYIAREARLFEIEYISNAIESKDKEMLKQSLAKYIVDSGYNYNIIKSFDKIKINFKRED